MQERRVTIDRETHALSPNFTVFATQNPIEYEGTYPLPEAQKDRFMLKIPVDCAGPRRASWSSRSGCSAMIRRRQMLAAGAVQPVVSAEDFEGLRRAMDAITVREELVATWSMWCAATREHEKVLVGAGPRATQALLLASRANAALERARLRDPGRCADA